MIFLTVSVLALSFPGCGKKENTSDRTLRVGIVTYTQDDPFINTMTEQIREDLKLKESKDMKILVSVKNGDNDQRDQDELVEEMIAAGCDVLCVNLVDRTAPSDIIKAARQEKIPVIFFNREPVKEDLMQWDQLYYVGCDAKQSGEMQGEIAADYLKAHPGADKNQEQLFPLIRKKLITYINGYVITEELEDPEHYVVPASLHDDQGIMGCLELARRALEG